MAAAFVLGYLAARPSWLIAYACASAVVTVALLYYAIDTGDRALSPTDEDTAAWVARLGLHNYEDEWWMDEAPGNLVPAFLPAPTDLVPGAGVLDAPVTTATCAGAMSTPKVDSPAPEDVPGPEVGTAERAHGDPVAVAGDPAAGPLPTAPPPVHLPWQRFSAIAVLAAFTAPVRAHVDRAEQAKREALQEEALAVFPPWEPWAGDDTLTSMRAIKAGA